MKKILSILVFSLIFGISGAALAAELYGWYRMNPRAKITLFLCPQKGKKLKPKKATTDNKGYYRFRKIRPGKYRITINPDCQRAHGWPIYVTPGYSRFDLP